MNQSQQNSSSNYHRDGSNPRHNSRPRAISSATSGPDGDKPDYPQRDGNQGSGGGYRNSRNGPYRGQQYNRNYQNRPNNFPRGSYNEQQQNSSYRNNNNNSSFRRNDNNRYGGGGRGGYQGSNGYNNQKSSADGVRSNQFDNQKKPEVDTASPVAAQE